MDAERVLFYGVLQSGDSYVIVGYGLNLVPISDPVGNFPLGISGMLDALAEAKAMTDGLPK